MSARSQAHARIAGLYGIADATASGGDPERLAAQLLEGGCRLVQLRAKGWQADAVVQVARRVVLRCHEVGATFILNDDPALAAACGADGVHVGQTDMPTAQTRALVGADCIIGRSTNDPTHIARVDPDVDYLAFGPVFPTSNLSRPKQVQGLALLREVRGMTERPLVAIGGIDLHTIQLVLKTGVDACAVIGAVVGSPDPVAATRALVQQW